MKFGWLNWTRKSFWTALFLLFINNIAQAENPIFESRSVYIDLEEKAQDFVLETKKIEISGYPDAFNASIVRWHNRYLMSFRVIPDPKHVYVSWIGLVWLDDDFHPVGEPQLINVRDSDSKIPSRAEDARLIVINDQLWMVYADNLKPTITIGSGRVFVAQVCEECDQFYLDKIECLSCFERQSPQIRERNWVPFNYQGNLLLAYSLSPHTIFLPLLHGTNQCETISSTSCEINWPWGALRGGTPALEIENGEYLAFFHSSIDMASEHSDGKVISHYFIGAYTFSNQPPFAIQRISPEPIIGTNFYRGKNYKPYWKPVHVVFPCGFVMDDRFIWISYGRQDREIWITKLDRAGLMNHIIPVEQ